MSADGLGGRGTSFWLLDWGVCVLVAVVVDAGVSLEPRRVSLPDVSAGMIFSVVILVKFLVRSREEALVILAIAGS